MPIRGAPSEAPRGLVVATGFQKGEIMTAPCTAFRSLVTGKSTPFPLAPFRLSRFADRSPDFGLVNIYTVFHDQ